MLLNFFNPQEGFDMIMMLNTHAKLDYSQWIEWTPPRRQ